MSTM
jgi:hypothetical protein